MKRLTGAGGPDGHVARFLERADRLGDQLGPILVQLPPNWHVNTGRLDAFLDAAPDDHRWAVEFRDPSWFTEEVWEVLRRLEAALVAHDMLRRHAREGTADWVYLRFHGTADAMPYGGNYSPQALSATARRVKKHLAMGRDVYAYFNNDAEGHAVRDALRLRRYVLGQG